MKYIGITLMGIFLISSLGAKEYSIEFSSKDLGFQKVESYDLLMMPNLGYNTEIGMPTLPLKTAEIAIPSGVKVIGVKVVSVESEPLPGEYVLLPVQPPTHIGEKASIVPPNPEVYSSRSRYPQNPVKFIGQGDVAGQEIAAFQVYPVEYIPGEKKIIFNKRIVFSLITTAGEPPKRINLRKTNKSVYERMIKSMVLNPEAVVLEGGSPKSALLPSGNYDYVIITPSWMEDSWGDLLNWKRKKGLLDTVITTDWIYANYSGSDSPTKIRNFIIDANSTWGTLWFLIGGDANSVPMESKYYEGDWVPSDMFYSDYDDDWYCEVFVGRAPVDNSSQVTTFTDKVLNYETDPPLSDYPLNILLIGMDVDDQTHCEYLKDYIDNYYIPSQFNVTKVYDSQSGNHKTAAINALNEGQNLVNHADHADWDLMGVGMYYHYWYLSISDINNLTNNNKPSIVYSLGCWDNAFDYTYDCISEYWIVHNPSQAGVAFTGNTRYGWYQVGNPMSLSGKYDREWWRSLFSYNKYKVGETLADAKNRNYPYDNYNRYCDYELSLLGDPEMSIWTDTPDSLDATYPATIYTGTQDFTVTVTHSGSPVESALVCLYKESEVFARGNTNSSGQVTLSINPQTAGVLFVTITKQNFLPYQGISIVNEASCMPGDANGDGAVTISDLTYTANYLFIGGPNPTDCADANGDCEINTNDLIYLANYLFDNGPDPLPPCSQGK